MTMTYNQIKHTLDNTAEGIHWMSFFKRLRLKHNDQYPYTYLPKNRKVAKFLMDHFGKDTITHVLNAQPPLLVEERFEPGSRLMKQLTRIVDQTTSSGKSNETYALLMILREPWVQFAHQTNADYDFSIKLDVEDGVDIIVTGNFGKESTVQVKPFHEIGMAHEDTYNTDYICYATPGQGYKLIRSGHEINQKNT